MQEFHSPVAHQLYVQPGWSIETGAAPSVPRQIWAGACNNLTSSPLQLGKHRSNHLLAHTFGVGFIPGPEI